MHFADPEKNIVHLGLKDGMIVADLGTGSGLYAMEAAKLVSPRGKVYAVDIQNDLLERLDKEARSLGIFNLETIWGNIDASGGAKIKDNLCDAVIISNALFQAEEKESFAKEATRILKKGGKLLFIDWTDSFGLVGPHPDHVITKDAGRKLFESNGLSFVKDFDAGSHHWGILFQKG